MAGAGAWRSLVSALVWGTRGPEFKSRRPDEGKAPLIAGFSAEVVFCKLVCLLSPSNTRLTRSAPKDLAEGGRYPVV